MYARPCRGPVVSFSSSEWNEALGDNASAVENCEHALQHVPEQRTALVLMIERAFETLNNRS
jgi:hypothetical protein